MSCVRKSQRLGRGHHRTAATMTDVTSKPPTDVSIFLSLYVSGRREVVCGLACERSGLRTTSRAARRRRKHLQLGYASAPRQIS
jgi:hypothetical protein